MDRFLDRLELRMNRAYWGDGLLDLFCGLALLIIGVSWVTGEGAFGAIMPALLVPLWQPFRRRFTEPRLGTVELTDERQHRTRVFARLLLVAGTLSFLLGIGVYFAHTLGLEPSVLVVKALPGSMIGIAAVATAEALQLRRFFLYGAVTMVGAVVVGVVRELNPGWAFLAGGAVALLGGIVLAYRFVRSHPVRSEEAAS